MIDQIRKSLSLVDQSLRIPLTAVIFMTTVTAALETGGIGLIFLFFQIAMNPRALEQHDSLRWLYQWVGGSSYQLFLGLLCAVVFLVLVFRTASQLLTVWLAVDLRRKTQIHLAMLLFESYLRAPYSFHLRTGSAALYNLITYSVPQSSQNCVVGLVEIASGGILFSFLAAGMLYLKPLETLIPFTVIGVVACVYWIVTRDKFARWGTQAKEAADAMFPVISETLHGIKTVKVMHREDYFTNMFYDRVSCYASMQLRQGLIGHIPRNIFELLLSTGLLGTMGIALAMGIHAAELVPTLALYGAVAYRLIPALTRISAAFQTLRCSKAALDAVHSEVVRIRAESCGRDDKTIVPQEVSNDLSFRHAIALSGISYAYEGAGKLAVQNVSLVIPKGEMVAFVGLSGSGKTTLVDILLGLLTPSVGTMTIDNVPVRFRAKWSPKLFGYVPQEAFLVNSTLRRNIAFGVPDKAIDEERVLQAVRASSLDLVVANLPKGLDSMIGERGILLSGGERQRLGLARTLYHDPEILVLDEPTSALDALTEASVSRAIRAQRGKKTIITIAHRLSTIRDYDRLFFLSEGRLVDVGTFDELLARNAAFRELVDQLRLSEQGRLTTVTTSQAAGEGFSY